MKQYLLISNTKENKINNNILKYLLKKFENITFEKNNFRELSPQKAYELELQNKDINLELKKFTADFLLRKNIDCNFIKEKKIERKSYC